MGSPSVILTAAQALAAYAASHSIAPVVVVDTASNLYADAAALIVMFNAGKLTSVSISGTNVLSAHQAEGLSGIPGIKVQAGASLVLSDTVANLLSAANAGALGIATGILLTGTSNTVTLANASLLVSHTLSVATGATLVVSDSAANLLTVQGGVLAAATGFVLAGSNTITAANVVALSGLGVTFAPSAVVSVVDTAADLAANIAAVGSFARSGGTVYIVVSGNSTVSAADATAIAALPHVSFATGARLVISDSAANLLLAGNAAGLAIGTSYVLTGLNSVNVAGATTLAKHAVSLASGATLVVADSLVHVLAASKASLAAATGIVLTGANAVTASKGAALVALGNVSLAVGATLVLGDTAANILAPGNAGALTIATGILLSGASNVVTVAAAGLLLAHGLVLAAGAHLVVSDTGLNLIAASPSVLAAATGVMLSGDSTVNVAQATLLAAIPGLTTSPSAVLHVIDTAANLLGASAAALAKASYIVVSAGTTNVVTAAQMAQLAAMHGFGTQSGQALGVDLQVVDSAANVLAALASVSRFATSTVLTGPNTVSAAQALSLATIYDLSVGGGVDDGLVVSDTLAATQAAFAATARPGYGLPTSGISEIVTGVSASDAAAVQNNTYGLLANVTSFSVTDTAAGFEAAADALNFDSKLTAVTLTDTGNIYLTYQQFAGISHVLSLLTKTNLTINVTQVPVAAAAAMQADPQVASFSVSDNFASVSVGYIELAGYSHLAAPITPLLVESYDSGAALIYPEYNADSLYLLAVPVAQASTIQATSSVGLFTVVDTAAEVTSGIVGLEADSKLTALAISGGTTTNGTTLDLTGLVMPVTINLGADNTASVSAGLSAPVLSLLTPPDVVTLSTGYATIDFALAPTSGIEEISHFQYGSAQLVIDLKGSPASVLVASDTTVGGVAAISIYSSSDPTHGIVLLNSAGLGNAASLMASHVSVSGGVATVQ